MKINRFGHLQVRMPKADAEPHVKAWLTKLSVNDTLPRGKAFTPYRSVGKMNK